MADQKIFAVVYHYHVEKASQRDTHRSAHREFLTSLGEAMVAAGAYVAEPDQALLLVRAGSADEVRHLLEPDPFGVHGLIGAVEIHEWSCAVGTHAAALRGEAS